MEKRAATLSAPPVLASNFMLMSWNTRPQRPALWIRTSIQSYDVSWTGVYAQDVGELGTEKELWTFPEKDTVLLFQKFHTVWKEDALWSNNQRWKVTRVQTARARQRRREICFSQIHNLIRDRHPSYMKQFSSGIRPSSIRHTSGRVISPTGGGLAKFFNN